MSRVYLCPLCPFFFPTLSLIPLVSLPWRGGTRSEAAWVSTLSSSAHGFTNLKPKRSSDSDQSRERAALLFLFLRSLAFLFSVLLWAALERAEWAALHPDSFQMWASLQRMREPLLLTPHLLKEWAMNPKHTETRWGRAFGCIEECEALFFFLLLQEILKALFSTIKHNTSHRMSGYNEIPQNSLCVIGGHGEATFSSFFVLSLDVMRWAGNGQSARRVNREGQGKVSKLFEILQPHWEVCLASYMRASQLSSSRGSHNSLSEKYSW